MLDLIISDIDQIAAVGLVSLTAIISLIGFIKLGLLSKLREVITGIIIGSFMFLAHIAYSPQKRRISEDDLLDNKMRLQIVEYLEEKGEQGAHLREIQRIIGCGISSLLWHLQALDDFKAIPEIKEAYLVYGVYDIVSRIEAETMEHLKDTISWKIRRLDKVRSTLTMIVYGST